MLNGESKSEIYPSNDEMAQNYKRATSSADVRTFVENKVGFDTQAPWIVGSSATMVMKI